MSIACRLQLGYAIWQEEPRLQMEAANGYAVKHVCYPHPVGGPDVIIHVIKGYTKELEKSVSVRWDI